METSQEHDSNTPKLIPPINLEFTIQSLHTGYGGGEGWSKARFLSERRLEEPEIAHALKILEDSSFAYVEWGNEESHRRVSRANGVYVNVYRVTREYGGPEEGGWWYEYEHPVEHHLVRPEEAAVKKSELEKQWGPGDDSLGPIGSEQFMVLVEPQPGIATIPPRYE